MIENLAAALRLLVVTDDALVEGQDPVDLCRAAVRGGATALQLRLKRAKDRDLLQLARRLIAAVPVPVFVNDRVDIAVAAGAAGVHVGPDDLAPALARRIVPDHFVIGASVGGDGELERGAVADYWGIGPLHASTTKSDAGAALGLAGAVSLLHRAAGRPCVVIGGVMPSDVGPAMQAGFAGVAVASGILASADIEQSARQYIRPTGEA